MSESEGTSIDLSVNVDGALQTLQELATAAKAADTTIQELKQHLTEQVAQTFGAQGLRPQNYEQAQGFLQRMPAADLQAAAPEIAATQQAISQRSATITGAAMDVTGAPGGANQPVQQLLDQVRQLLTVQQQRAAGGVPDAGGSGASPQARYGGTPSGGSGSPWPAATSLLGGTSPTDATQQDRGANLIGQRMAEALTHSAGGLMAGGINGAFNAAGMGATGDLVSGLARPLMAALGDALPLAAGALGVVGGAVGIGLGVNSLQSKYAGERQELAGSVGTTTGATPSSELDAARQAGWALMFHESDSVAAARQLGMAGVQSGQLGTAVTASGDLARVGGIGLDQTTALTAQMMQGGMSANQVGDTYAQMDQAARVTGVSLTRLINGVKELGQAAGIGQISVNGLAAATAISGLPGSTFAQAISGTVGSTGTSALSQGAMLGLTPTQFEAAQRDPAKLMNSYANLARRYDVGTGGVQVAQQALSSAGFDFSGMKGPQADEFTRRLVAQGPGAAQAYEVSLTKKENAPGAPGPHTFAELTQASVTVAHNITSATDQFKIGVEQAAAGFVNSISGAADRGTGVAHTVAHARAAHRVNADGTISDSTGMPIVNIPPSLQAAQDRLRGNVTRFGNDGTTYYSDGTPQAATGGVGTHPGLTGNPYGTGLHYAEQQGMSVKNIAGFAQAASPEVVRALDAASKRTGVPVQVLLAQAAQETSNFNKTAISNDGGYGLAQMTDPKVAQQYLSQAAHELHKPVSSDWHQMAFNPAISAQAMADYDKANFLSKQGAGSWARSLAMYNGGPNGWNITGHPGQGRDYGTGIAQRAEEVQHRLAITVTTQDQSGRHTGRTHVTHSIDTSRKHVGAQSYGPDQRPPSLGLPNFPGHIK